MQTLSKIAVPDKFQIQTPFLLNILYCVTGENSYMARPRLPKIQRKKAEKTIVFICKPILTSIKVFVILAIIHLHTAR